MANEELVQRNYLSTGKLKGDSFGSFEALNIGATTIDELSRAGLRFTAPLTISYAFKKYKPTRKPGSAKPDMVFLRRDTKRPIPAAVGEFKRVAKFDLLKAGEQALHNAAALGVRVAITTDGSRYHYIDVDATLNAGELVYFKETRDLNPAVLENLLHGDAGVIKDPKPLAESVWQLIWHATKADPDECLLTFVEIFVLKFLSDNLPKRSLPEKFSFYELNRDPKEFLDANGSTAIEYYINQVRPHIKKLFPDNSFATDTEVAKLFGLKSVVSKTSIINGFAFLQSSADQSLSSYNRTFLEILDSFNSFGPLTAIDPEFKLRLYETFLKRSASQQKLGQFFTPRNVVRPMIQMAQLARMKPDSILLDPAAGVGGFVLEPMLIEGSLEDNLKFKAGKATRNVRTIGVDVLPNTHILAKANMLIHCAEAVRDPNTTIESLNEAMANTFILMRSSETLGALEHPPHNSIDIILTNPPYVTRGSGIYKAEIDHIEGTRNGIDLRDYYDRWGLGLEALFLRYISGALKPGGRAFIIVPLGMLNRTDPGPKRKLLEECNIIASIALPRNTFFNTAQLTYIIGLEKRRTTEDPRPPVLCAIPSSIGESLDFRRMPNPSENELSEVAAHFIAHDNGKAIKASPFVKSISPEHFSESDRWDVMRFWSSDELVSLGRQESAIDRASFIDEVDERLSRLAYELAAAKAELEVTAARALMSASLGDTRLFEIRSGERLTTANVRANPGEIPVYSCFKTAELVKGLVSEDFLNREGFRIEELPFVSINANGASVGKVFVRRERCFITDDVILVRPIDPKIDLDYLAYQLRSAIASGNFIYEAKLFTGRVKELEVEIPVDDSGFAEEKQIEIASSLKRFDGIRDQLFELGDWSVTAHVK